MKTTVIILAAGKGKRMNSNINKQYIEINNKPILVYTLEKFQESECIDEIVLVVGKEDIEYVEKEIKNKYCFEKINYVVEGGVERQDSVYEGIKKVSNDTDIILIHDGARPFVSISNIRKLVNEIPIHKACILGVKVKDTIKMVDNDGYIVNTPDRKNLYAAQTPQGFLKDIIEKAYEIGINENKFFTDDSMLVEEYLNTKVKVVEGSYENIKITTKEDIDIAKRYIEEYYK